MGAAGIGVVMLCMSFLVTGGHACQGGGGGAVCTSPCQNGGTCTESDTCDCTDTGYTGSSCTEAICDQACENGGTCTRPNVCSCRECFTGAYCQDTPANPTDPVGIAAENGASITDDQMTASSRYAELTPYEARLNNDALCWASGYANADQWLRVDFLTPSFATGIQSQGYPGKAQWVKTYQVQSGDSSDSLTFIQEGGLPKTFTANVNYEDIVTNMFPSRIYARYIQIHPVSWEWHIAMRIEILGCVPSQ